MKSFEVITAGDCTGFANFLLADLGVERRKIHHLRQCRFAEIHLPDFHTHFLPHTWPRGVHRAAGYSYTCACSGFVAADFSGGTSPISRI